MRSFLKYGVLFVGLSFLSSCSMHGANDVLLGSKLSRFNKERGHGGKRYNRSEQLGSSGQALDHRKSRFFPGTGRFTGKIIRVNEVKTYEGKDGVTLNLIKASIPQAAKAIIGDTLQANYTIDERIKGSVTIQTTNAVSKDALLDIFSTVLEAQGVAIVEDNNYYKLLPASDIAKQARRITRRFGSKGKRGVGKVTMIAPLQFVSAQEMSRILKPLAPPGSILHIDKSRNILILSGTNSTLDAIQESISVFDVDQMRGMSFALTPVKNSDPDDIVKELEAIFRNDQAGPAKGLLRFISNKRLNAVLVISPQSKYLRTADKWIKRLDRAGRNTSEQMYVYKIQNRPAAELTQILQQVFLGGSNGTGGGTGVSPKFTGASLNNPGASNTPGGLKQPPGVVSRAVGNSKKKIANLRIVTDEANNSLLIMASPRDYKRILRVLERIDVMPNQVLLEATIAEVSLNDELRYGLKWFFEKGNSGFTLSEAATGAVTSAFPGFSYFFSTPKVQVALDALASITDVKVVSSPSVMVLDNKKAVLQVGDQVPIATQSAVSVNDNQSPIVNSVSFKDTGVILTVRPRVNDSGRVLLEIEQEVSDVTQTTSSGIDSPTIQQRKIKTTVVVDDGSSLTLGGLIQNSNNKNNAQVPLLGDIPVLGNLFKQKRDAIKRTELLIIITPRVVRDNYEAHKVTDEFRQKLNESIRSGRPNAEQNFRRVFQ